MVVGSNIKSLRIKNKLTQKELSEILGVSRQALCMWEADRRQLKASTLREIAKFFKVPADDLIYPDNNIKGKRGKIMKKPSSKTTKTKTQKKSKVKFQLMAPEARKVYLTGEFANWKAQAIKMRKTKTGVWSTAIECTPGSYQYKFVVDDQWWTDPENEKTVQTAMGSINSVKEVNV